MKLAVISVVAVIGLLLADNGVDAGSQKAAKSVKKEISREVRSEPVELPEIKVEAVIPKRMLSRPSVNRKISVERSRVGRRRLFPVLRRRALGCEAY